MKSIANNTTGVTTSFIGTVNSPQGIAAIFNSNAGGPLASFRNSGVQEIGFDASGDVTAAGVVTGSQLVSTVATGTPPLKVASTTLVPNLNAGYLGGTAASGFATLGANSFTASQNVAASNLAVWIGDVGCGGTSGGINFGAPNACTNYALVGGTTDTYLNRPKGGTMHFGEGGSASDEMTLATGGGLTILAPATGSAVTGLTVTGSATSGEENTGDGIHAYGGDASASSDVTINGGNGIVATGGSTNDEDEANYAGDGGQFFGGNYSAVAGGGDGVYAVSGSGISVPTYAGYFSGNVDVAGTLSKTSGSFKIDHPLDPANKYLYHSFVESPDMMNIYNGMVTLDSGGEAVVQLPDWFESLNRDFRYQLTAVGAPGPNLYIAEKIANGHFKIAGGSPGKEVSWQVTGIRQDAWANAHRIQVEVEKPERERGYYIHPELYGASPDKQVAYAGRPDRLRHAREARRRNPERKGPSPVSHQQSAR
jgi:hypothetical protein